jgi:hypothetical protein
VKTAQMRRCRRPSGSQTGPTPGQVSRQTVSEAKGGWRGAADGGELVPDVG